MNRSSMYTNPAASRWSLRLGVWSVGLGLSSLFAAPIFSGGRIERLIRLALLLNGIFCLLGGLGYALDIEVLVFWTLNFGMGGAVLATAIFLVTLFRRIDRRLGDPARNFR